MIFAILHSFVGAQILRGMEGKKMRKPQTVACLCHIRHHLFLDLTVFMSFDFFEKKTSERRSCTLHRSL